MIYKLQFVHLSLFHYLLCYQTIGIRFKILIMKLRRYNPRWRAGDTQILGLKCHHVTDVYINKLSWWVAFSQLVLGQWAIPPNAAKYSHIMKIKLLGVLNLLSQQELNQGSSVCSLELNFSLNLANAELIYT